jgi:hypothetical protein
MLRGIVGDSTFFNIMRAYSDDPDLKYGVATTEDFQGVAESVSGQDLEYFFQEWIYGENFPTYSIGWNSSIMSGDIYNVSLNIYQNVNTNPAYFTMPVQVQINTALGDTIVTLFNDAQTQNFQFQVIGEPQSIVFDPGSWILKDIGTVTRIKNSETPIQFILGQNYPNPFNPSTTIQYSIPESENVMLIVYNSLGEVVETLVNGFKVAGTYKVNFEATKSSSGIYYYRLSSGNFSKIRKMIILK